MAKNMIVLFLSVMSIFMVIGCGPEVTEVTEVTVLQVLDGNENFQNIYQANIRSVAKIYVDKCEQSTGNCTLFETGSGFVIAPGIMATNDHVGGYLAQVDTTSNPPEVYYYQVFVRYPETDSLDYDQSFSPEYEATAVFRIINRDIALLQVETLDRAPLVLSQRNWASLEILEPVMAMGYPLSMSFIPTLGEINKPMVNSELATDMIPWVDGDTKLIKASAVIDAGNSGGPLLDEFGEVIGVNFAGITGVVAEHYFALTINYVTAIDQINITWEQRQLP